MLNDTKLASSGFRVSITPSNRNKNKNAAILDFHVPSHGISTTGMLQTDADYGLALQLYGQRPSGKLQTDAEYGLALQFHGQRPQVSYKFYHDIIHYCQAFCGSRMG